MSLIGKASEQYSQKPVLRSLLQLLPGWGSADELLQQRANELREERVRTFFDELAGLEHELTEELINSENFLHSYFSTMKAVIATRRHEKIKLLADLFKGSVILRQDDPDAFEEELNILDDMSFREIQILYVIEKHQKWDQLVLQPDPETWEYKYKLIVKEEEFSKSNEGIKDSIASELEIDRILVDGMLIRLSRTGLLERVTTLTDIEDRDYILGPLDCLRLSPLYYRIKEALRIAGQL